MRYNKLVWVAWVATFAVVAAVLLTVSAAPPSEDVDSSDGQQVASGPTSVTKMPSLFDFEAYKRLFKKSYSGVLENMARFKYFTSRALRASISAIKYRFRQAKYYLAINFMSDMSQEELDKMRNKVLESEYDSGRAGKKDDLPEFIPADDENVVADLRRLIDENAGKPEFEALRAQLEEVDIARKQQLPSTRRKREVELAEEGPRELPLSKLIIIAPEDPDAELSAETRARIREHPASNNPLYEGIEMSTQGLIDQQRTLKTRYLYQNQPLAKVDVLVNLQDTLDLLRQKYLAVNDDTFVAPAKLPDEAFIDLRKSSCMFAPRSQIGCGACYAFAATTVAEWVHCRATGELVAFSEQYMVDCGKAYQSAEIFGCQGAKLSNLNMFFHNFGFELRSSYPYVRRELQCPYEPDTDLRTTGYIRADLIKAIQYDMSMWPKVLDTLGPLMIGMHAGDTFHEYASGVYDACEPKKPDHAVVLVGHGREDGEEYWLIRNSYSVGWGEGGYMKLSKKADCIWPRIGQSFGSDDGASLKVKPFKNRRNGGQITEKYLTEMSKDFY